MAAESNLHSQISQSMYSGFSYQMERSRYSRLSSHSFKYFRIRLSLSFDYYCFYFLSTFVYHITILPVWVGQVMPTQKSCFDFSTGKMYRAPRTCVPWQNEENKTFLMVVFLLVESVRKLQFSSFKNGLKWKCRKRSILRTGLHIFDYIIKKLIF